MSKILALLTLMCFFALLVGCDSLQLGNNKGNSYQAGSQSSVEAEASVDVSYKANWQGVAMAKLPPKYAQWQLEVDAYFKWVNWNVAEIVKVRAGIATLFGVSANASASEIADAIRSTVKVKAKLVVQTEADLNASSGMSTDSAYAQANSSGFAKVQWQTETTVDPSIRAKLDQVQFHIQSLVKIQYVINSMEKRGNELSNRGMRLHAECVTDIAKEPTLVMQSGQIQASLKDGSNKCVSANAKVVEVKADTHAILNAMQTTFK